MERALGLLREVSLPQEEMETLIGLFYLQHRLGHAEACEDYLAQIARLLPQLNQSRYELIWPELVALFKTAKEPQEALGYYRQKARLARRLRSPEHLYVALANQAILEKNLGEDVKARQTSRRAESLRSAKGRSFPPRLQRLESRAELE
jgi:hypothetical protein